MLIVKIIRLNDENLALIVADPLLVSFVKVAQILDADALLVVTAAFLNLGNKGRYRGFEINQQIRLPNHRHHKIEQMHIGLEVAVRKVAHSLVVGNEDMNTFKNGPVLDDDLVRLCNLQQILETLCQEVGLKIV